MPVSLPPCTRAVPVTLAAVAILGCWPQAALALPSDCAQAHTNAELAPVVENAGQALLNPNPAVREKGLSRLQDLQQILLCLDEPADRALVGRLARFLATAAFLEQDLEDTERWVAAARLAAPGGSWPKEAPVRLAVTVDEPELQWTDLGNGFSIGRTETLYSSGRPLTSAAAPAGVPHLVQIADRDGSVLAAWWQDGALFPEEVLSDEPGTPSPPPSDDPPLQRCIGFDAHHVHLLAEQSKASLKGDPAVHDRAMDRLEALIPCLTQPLPADDWASLVRIEAIQRFDESNGDPSAWLSWLETAHSLSGNTDLLEDRPDIQSAYQTYRVPLSASAVQVPPSTFLVDGVMVQSMPDLRGTHILQRRTDGGLESRWWTDNRLPEDWLGSNTSEPSSRRRGKR